MSREAVSPQVRAELELHIEMRARDNMRAGMGARAARADARRRFGDLEKIGARCTDIHRPRAFPGTLRGLGLFGLLLAVLALVHALPPSAFTRMSEAKGLLLLAALTVTLLAFAVTFCCINVAMVRRLER